MGKRPRTVNCLSDSDSDSDYQCPDFFDSDSDVYQCPPFEFSDGDSGSDYQCPPFFSENDEQSDVDVLVSDDMRVAVAVAEEQQSLIRVKKKTTEIIFANEHQESWKDRPTRQQDQVQQLEALKANQSSPTVVRQLKHDQVFMITLRFLWVL